jgi:hypothetical protein
MGETKINKDVRTSLELRYLFADAKVSKMEILS